MKPGSSPRSLRALAVAFDEMLRRREVRLRSCDLMTAVTLGGMMTRHFVFLFSLVGLARWQSGCRT